MANKLLRLNDFQISLTFESFLIVLICTLSNQPAIALK